MKSAFGVIAVAAVTSALGTACSKSPEEKPSTNTESMSATPLTPMTAPTQMQMPEPQAAPPSNAGNAGAKDVTYTAPAGWSLVPSTSAMRKATYKIPRVSGDSADGEMSVIVASGGVDENIKRWAGQFGNATPKTEKRAPNGLTVTFVEMKGTYGGGMPGMGQSGGPKDHMMLLGAIVDFGDSQWFFKATGPEKTMSASKGDFDQFVASFKSPK